MGASLPALAAAMTSFFGVALSVGATMGFGDRVGVPSWRLLSGLSVQLGQRRVDSDRDGLYGAADQCPDLPEDRDGFRDDDGCPDADNDNDGVRDTLDACADEPEDRDGFRDSDGCPDVDNDGDGLLDNADTCPNQGEDPDGFMDSDGCPDLDNDGDGVFDQRDTCPTAAETHNGFQDDDGCPDERPRYVFRFETPLILYSILFKSGSDELLEASSPVLDDLAESLRKQASLKVRVEGHTDDRGDDDRNLSLSQRRALSVINALIERGIDRRRLTYQGYGESRPMVPNTTNENRARNRRVEFLVVP